MPANSTVWRFTKVGGDRFADGVVLELSDHCAPHGRPRRKPVVEPELLQRIKTTRFAGNSPPVRHIFGVMHESEKINGRLCDNYGGLGFAKAKRKEIQEFVGAGVQCIVTWDDIINQSVFIHRVKFGVESGSDITYELEFEVDEDHLHGVTVVPALPDARGPSVFSLAIEDTLRDMHKLVEVPGMRGSIVDSISSLIASVNSASSALSTVAGEIDSFANAPFQLLNQLRAALDQFRTVAQQLRKTYDDLDVHIALENQNASSWHQFWDIQSAWSESSLDAIRAALAAERATAIAQAGSIKALYTGRDGDTWEQIARTVYGGDPTRASEIREANGVEPGVNPVPGTTYMVPV
jgi:hypothetical protein